MVNNILVLSAHTKNMAYGVPEHDEYGKLDYAEISSKINKQYADINGYDFKCIEYDIKYKDYWPTWVKVKAILEHIYDYDYVFWIDADAIFMKNIPLDFLIGKDIAITKEYPNIKFDKTLSMVNTGFMLIKNTKFSINLLHNLLSQAENWDGGSFKESNWHEQGLLDKMYIRPQVIQTYKFTSDYYRLVDHKHEDIDNPFETENFIIFPNKYQMCGKNENEVGDIGNIEFIFHATAGHHTKRMRLEEASKYVNFEDEKNRITYSEDEENKITYSFIRGAKVEITGSDDKEYLVEFWSNSGDILYYWNTITNNMWTEANKKWYTDWVIKIYSDDILIEEYKFNCKGKKVYIHLDNSNVTEWFPYVEEFRKKHNCKVVCSGVWNDWFREEYKEIEFVKPGIDIDDLYAIYAIGIYRDGEKMDTLQYHPRDYEISSKHGSNRVIREIAMDILGLDYNLIEPKVIVRETADIVDLNINKDRISILCPTRKRASQCIKACDSLLDKASKPENVELLFAFDDDDTASAEIINAHYKSSNADFKSFVYPRYGYQNLHLYVNDLCFNSTGEWLFLWNDDCIMLSDGWDDAIRSYTDQFVMINPKTFPEEVGLDNLWFPIIPRLWYETTGRLSGNAQNDGWLQMLTDVTNNRVWENSIEILHDRADITGNNDDDTYRERVYDTERLITQSDERYIDILRILEVMKEKRK